jgi:hypothetical protein
MRGLFRFWFALTIALAPVSAFAAGGAFVVDDAAIGKPGECKVESWMSLASNHDMLAVTQPACVVNLGIPVELGGTLARSRSSDVWQTGAGPKAKVNLLPVETGRVGVGIAGSAVWNVATGKHLFNLLYVPVTFQPRDNFRINLNAGWQYDGTARLNYAFWGAGFEWNFTEPLTLIGEVFGLAGALPAVNPGDPPSPNSTVEPRAQLGLRYTPQKDIDIDVIWGHNITGENAQWITLGLNVRFDLGH